MPDADPVVEVVLRIPGLWNHPGELVERLPRGYRLTPDEFILPDGTRLEFNPMPRDDQFAQIFCTSCRRRPTEEEWNQIGDYQVNIGLRGPGGSLDAAKKVMEAGAAIVRAGGLGVFNDNSGLAHGGQNWLYMTEEGSPDAVSFAFVGIVRGKTEMYTMGMHVLGLRDVLMQRVDVEENGFDIVEVIQYLANGDKPIGDGHVIADLNGPCFQAFAVASPPAFQDSPMHNPFGRLKLVSVKDVAGQN